jgi:hypothetical protein
MDELADLSTGDAAAIDQLRALYDRDDHLGPTAETLAAMVRDDIAGTGRSNTITSG